MNKECSQTKNASENCPHVAKNAFEKSLYCTEWQSTMCCYSSVQINESNESKVQSITKKHVPPVFKLTFFPYISGTA